MSTEDMAGTFVQAGAASRMADGSVCANSTLVFPGTVTGRGTGTATMRSRHVDPATGIGTGVIEYKVK